MFFLLLPLRSFPPTVVISPTRNSKTRLYLTNIRSCRLVQKERWEVGSRATNIKSRQPLDKQVIPSSMSWWRTAPSPRHRLRPSTIGETDIVFCNCVRVRYLLRFALLFFFFFCALLALVSYRGYLGCPSSVCRLWSSSRRFWSVFLCRRFWSVFLCVLFWSVFRYRFSYCFPRVFIRRAGFAT